MTQSNHGDTTVLCVLYHITLSKSMSSSFDHICHATRQHKRRRRKKQIIGNKFPQYTIKSFFFICNHEKWPFQYKNIKMNRRCYIRHVRKWGFVGSIFFDIMTVFTYWRFLFQNLHQTMKIIWLSSFQIGLSILLLIKWTGHEFAQTLKFILA